MTTLTEGMADALPSTEYLILEVLAARRRTGDKLWTFPSKLTPRLRSLERKGWVTVTHGIVEKTVRASLTDEAVPVWLDEHYKTPTARLIERHENLLASIALYIKWFYVTKQLTTEQKELFADSIDASHKRMDERLNDESLPANRWWRADFVDERYRKMAEVIADILAKEGEPSEQGFTPTRYPYTYAWDFVRNHQRPQSDTVFDFPSDIAGSRSETSGWVRKFTRSYGMDREEVAHLLADAYMNVHGITKLPGEYACDNTWEPGETKHPCEFCHPQEK